MMSAEDEKKSVYYDMLFAITVAVAFVAIVTASSCNLFDENL